jgi:hypothetical protein
MSQPQQDQIVAIEKKAQDALQAVIHLLMELPHENRLRILNAALIFFDGRKD